MSTLFEDLREGLLQAIDYADGNGSARTVTYKIDPVVEWDKDQIREIHMNAQMTQRVFAAYPGYQSKPSKRGNAAVHILQDRLVV